MVFRASKSSISFVLLQRMKRYKLSDVQLSARMAFRCLILLAFLSCLSFSALFCVNVLCSCVWCVVPDPLK